MSDRRWGGSATRRARAYWAPLIAAGGVDCSRCGLPVDADQAWHVDHVTALAEGGAVADPANHHPAHARCNMRHGGQLAQAMARGRRRGTVPPISQRVTRREWK